MIGLNKSSTTSTFKHSLLAASITLVLSACNSGSSSADSTVSTPALPKANLSGTVADGYLVNAKVCLDLNDNKKCDSDEPSTISNEGGTFTLSDVNQADIDAHPLVVEVIKNLTIDEDHPEQPVDGDYSMTAPAGYTFVSPLTTLVQQEIEENKDVEAYSVEDAEASVKVKLGTDLDMSTDYVAAQQDDSSVSEQDKEEYEQLHKVAQVTATVLKQNLDVVEQAVEASGQDIDFEQVMELVVAQVLDALETINQQVEADTGELSNFDPETVITDIKNDPSLSDDLTIDSETVVNEIEIREAEKAASSANMLELVQTEGVNWFYSDRHDSTLVAAHGTFKHIPATDTTPASSQETEYRFDPNSGAFIEDTRNGDDDDYLLTSDGWKQVPEQEDISINADGTISIVNPLAPEYAEQLEATAFDISGKNIALTLGNSDNAGYWSEFVAEDAQFPPSAQAFKLKFTTLNDSYEIWGGGCDNPEYEVEGMCNSVWVNSVNGPALSLDQLLSETASTDQSQVKGPQVAWFDNGSIIAEMLIDGTVNYYEVQYNNSSYNNYSPTTEFVTTGTWQDKTVNDVQMFILELPTKILGLGDYDYYERYILLTEYNGAVRRGEFVPAGTVEHDELTFNKSAAESIVDAFSVTRYDELVAKFNKDVSGGEPSDGNESPDGNETPDNSNPSAPPLETSLQPCTEGDSEWNETTDLPQTFATKAEYDAVLANYCTTSSAFTANDVVGKTFVFADEPTESIFFDTDSKARFTSVADNGAVESADLSWFINANGQLELTMNSADPETQGTEFRAVVSLLETGTNELSVKFYIEESEWYSGAEMDGSKGEIWSVILVEKVTQL